MPRTERFKLDEAPYIAMGLREATIAALESIAKEHGQSKGEWLDQIERDAISNTKNYICEGITMTQASKATEIAVRAIEVTFDTIREKKK